MGWETSQERLRERRERSREPNQDIISHAGRKSGTDDVDTRVARIKTYQVLGAGVVVAIVRLLAMIPLAFRARGLIAPARVGYHACHAEYWTREEHPECKEYRGQRPHYC